MYEQPSPGQRIGPSLIVIMVLIAAVAGTGAYLVARQVLAGDAGPSDGLGPGAGSSVSPGASNGLGGATTSAAATPTGPQTTPRASVNTKDPRTFCPALTEQAVVAAGLAGELKLLRYVEGTRSGEAGAEAWICKNSAGALFYQGHRKTGAFTAATSGDTILLGRGILGKVDTEGDDGFVATNPKNPANVDDPEHTEYHVAPKSFFLLSLPKNEKTAYTVTFTVP